MLRDVSVQVFVVVAVLTGAVIGAGGGVVALLLAAIALPVVGMVVLSLLWRMGCTEGEETPKG